MTKRLVGKMLCTGVLALALAAPGSAANFTPGSPGLGDPMFPNAGNGGYDVQHYGLSLDYTPSSNQMTATAVISARATQDLSSFNLDLRGFSISRLLVDGRAASFSRDGGQELTVTPRPPGIPAGATFTVAIDYAGTPTVVTDPDGSIEGWVPTDDGAFVVNEPQGSPAWYPCNDNPRDKATFDFSVTVPAGLTALANGVLVSNATSGGKTTWVWRETDPMSTYLATTTLGKFDLETSSVGGIPSYIAVDPKLAKGQVLSKLPEAVTFFQSIYGPYPFSAVGAIVDDAKVVGYSLETQTKPNFPSVPDELTLVHELSHMWFGDSLTLTKWPDIWLHEGFATWSEWIWSERQGNKSAAVLQSELQHAGSADLVLGARGRRLPRPGLALQRHRVRPRRHDARGLAREDRRPRLLPAARGLADAEPLRQRDHAGVHRAGRAEVGDGPDGVLRRLDLPGGEADHLVTEAGPLTAQDP
jgi:Peptidase family M1 domain/Peptidase M1 N-terminal domain